MSDPGRLRVVIVDDEPLARERLRTLLEKESDVEIVAECGDGRTAVETLDAERPDLVFLDVQMPELDGFAVLEALAATTMPAVVFVTAFDEHALRAFDVHALDYLLKPFDRLRFERALDHARRTLARPDAIERRIHRLLADLRATEKRTLDRIVVRSAGRIEFVDVDDIDWIAAAGNYVEIHAGDRTHLLRETLKGMEEKLDPGRFVRIHRSHIINLERIREIERWFHGEHIVFLTDGTELRASRTYSDRLSAHLDNRP